MIIVVFGVLIVTICYLIGSASILSFIARILVVLFLPGYSIALAVASKQFNLAERLIIAPVIGIAYTTITALYLSTLNIPTNQFTIILSILLVSVPLLAYSWKKGALKISPRPLTFHKTYIILAIFLLASIILISLPWSKNGILFPMGDDSATSTFAATLIAEQGKIPQSWAPYFPEQTHFAFSPGYPSVIASLYILDPSVSMPILVSFFTAFFALIHAQVFVLVKKIFHDYKIALTATAFSVLISIGFYQMIINGRFPALVGLALSVNLMLFLYLYSKTSNVAMLFLSALTFSSLILTYTVSFITAGLFVLIFSILSLIMFRNKVSILGGAATLGFGSILSLPWIINILGRMMVSVPPKEYYALLVWYNAYSLKGILGSTNVFQYYGYWLFLFGILCALLVFVKRRSGILFIAWFLSVFILMLNEIFRVEFPGWYYLQTGAFLNPFLSIPISVLAGIGFVKVYDLSRQKLQKSSSKLIYGKIAAAIMIALCTVSLFLGVTAVLGRTDIQTVRISAADYHAMDWLSTNTPKNSIIFNDHWAGTPSVWIPVISHRRIVMPLLSISEVGWSNLMFTRQDESIIIAKDPNSTLSLSILKNYNVSFIYLSNIVSDQVQNWRNNYDPQLFIQSPHYDLAFNEENAWIFKVIY